MRAEDGYAATIAPPAERLLVRRRVLTALFREHSKKLERFFARSGHSSSDVMDLVQDVFVRLWSCDLDLLTERPGYMVYRTARFVSIDAIRRRRVLARVGIGTWVDLADVEIGDNAPSQEQRLVWREAIAGAIAAIRSLPPKGGQVYWMSRVSEMSYREIAAKQGVSMRTVENHIAATASRFRVLLANGAREAA
jgi:RNA polymerase sigma-70 factor (ECF subfamily)